MYILWPVSEIITVCKLGILFSNSKAFVNPSTRLPPTMKSIGMDIDSSIGIRSRSVSYTHLPSPRDS